MIELLKDQLKEYSDKIKTLETEMIKRVRKTGKINIDELRPELDEISGLKMMQEQCIIMMDNYFKSGTIK